MRRHSVSVVSFGRWAKQTNRSCRSNYPNNSSRSSRAVAHISCRATTLLEEPVEKLSHVALLSIFLLRREEELPVIEEQCRRDEKRRNPQGENAVGCLAALLARHRSLRTCSSLPRAIQPTAFSRDMAGFFKRLLKRRKLFGAASR